MSIGGLRKVGKIRFPTIRRSTDVLQPERGDVDFSEALKDFDKDRARAISETEESSQKLIKDNEESSKQKKHKKQKDNDEEKHETTNHIDLQA
jgi:chromosome condensin MukBEF MukE localization factor